MLYGVFEFQSKMLKRKYLDVKFNVVVDLYVAQGYENSNLQKQPNLLNLKKVCT